MSDKMSSGKTKAEFVADALNRTLVNLVTRCTKSEGVRDYFEVGVIGYGDASVTNGFSGVLGSKAIKWNFTKFLVGKDGRVISRYAPQDTPSKIEKDILQALAA
jgi:glutathione peroxidase-family protein